jgi:hypothetical protein
MKQSMKGILECLVINFIRRDDDGYTHYQTKH